MTTKAMIRRGLAAFVGSCLLAAHWGPVIYAAPSLEAPMSFSFHRPCDGMGSICGDYILAHGMITRDTPRKLEALLKAQTFKPTVYFHSPGGDLRAGLELGRIIRRLMFDTYVGGPYEQFVQVGQPAKVIVSTGICLSACAYAFLGGVSRELNGGGRFGVHQFSGAVKDLGESTAQRATVVLAQYLDNMGVDRRLLDLASTTASESVRIISLRLARDLNVDNTDPPKKPWELKPDEKGNLYLIVAQRQPQRDGLTILVLRRSGNRVFGTIIYRIRQNFRSSHEMNEAFSSLTQFNFEANNQHYRTTAASKWERLSEDTFRMGIYAGQSILLRVAGARIFELEAVWPNALSDVDPSTEFGTVGLRNGIRALFK